MPDDAQGRVAKEVVRSLREDAQPVDAPLYRGIAVPLLDLQDWGRAQRSGEPIELAPSSWTTDRDVAGSFATPARREVAVVLELPPGQPTVFIDDPTAGESEHITAGQFLVKRIRSGTVPTVIELEPFDPNLQLTPSDLDPGLAYQREVAKQNLRNFRNENRRDRRATRRRYS